MCTFIKKEYWVYLLSYGPGKYSDDRGCINTCRQTPHDEYVASSAIELGMALRVTNFQLPCRIHPSPFMLLTLLFEMRRKQKGGVDAVRRPRP